MNTSELSSQNRKLIVDQLRADSDTLQALRRQVLNDDATTDGIVRSLAAVRKRIDKLAIIVAGMR